MADGVFRDSDGSLSGPCRRRVPPVAVGVNRRPYFHLCEPFGSMLWTWLTARGGSRLSHRGSGETDDVVPDPGRCADGFAEPQDADGNTSLPDAPVLPSTDVSRGMGHLHAVVGALASRMGSLESRFSLAASTLSGLSALQAAVAHDDHQQGRSLAACLRATLMDKLHACPPKPRTNSGRSHADQSKVRVEVACSLSAVEQLIDLRRLVHTTKSHPLPGRQTLEVELSGAVALADTLMMTPSMRAEAGARSFRRGGETRLLMEHVTTDDGRVIYVVERLRATGEVRIASRATEVFDGRLRRYVSSLDVEVVKAEDVEGLPDSYMGKMIWTESRHGVASAVGGHSLSAGKLVISVPVTVALGKAVDLVNLLKV